ncbi:EAL domain-containing protein [Caballeronia sp. LZ001]|uniref:sensor domain-containing phosphodiesterase n=1 Tax=Caballeronia sp. LZ001 TaxID=3038553 RepID=UPI00285DF256|nr:EAL domain-containing protein [Caballeronia sp. LZ001]MDR5798540.1 EAL domain-containing protein [Caballeronia sp. LZ001]
MRNQMQRDCSELDEEARLAALSEFGVDEVLSEPAFDRLVQLASNIFKVPVALVSLVDGERQLFAAGKGLDVCETSRDVSFCAYAMLQPGVTVVADALKDPRFCENPLVTGAPHIRFYAGAPLLTVDGHPLGTLCVIDRVPRDDFSQSDCRNLEDLAALVLDRLEMRRLELARQASQLRFEKIAATSPDAILCLDECGRITFWNEAAHALLGYTSESVTGCGVELIASDEFAARVRQLASDDATLAAGRTTETVVRALDGTEKHVELSGSMWRDHGKPSFGAILRDITERRRSEERLVNLALFDALTGLPNRALLRTRLEDSLAHDACACVMIVDLDGFKDVNDSLGHLGGDAVLIAVAKRLTSCVREADTVARMGGDEFAVLLPRLSSSKEAARVATAIINSIANPIVIEGESVCVGASVGIALWPQHGSTVRELLGNADLALYQAKSEGRRCWRFFTAPLREVASARRAYQGELLRAFEQGEFKLFYQPQVRLADGALVGVEALLRWDHPQKGLLTPGAFLEAVEAGQLTPQIGEWIIRSACHQASAWRERFGLPLRVGVNLFGAQFSTGDLARKVRQALSDYELPASCLELEITENIILRHDEQMIEPLRDLHDLGVSIAFDDYGTGYASLSMLKRYPLTRLKVDQSFVSAMLASSEDAAIIRAILFLGHSFGLEVIAEGVETEEQAERLRKKGCEVAQGFLYSAARDPLALEKQIQRRGGQLFLTISACGEEKRPQDEKEASQTSD